MLGKKKRYKSKLIIVVCLLVLIPLAVVFYMKFESARPTVEVTPQKEAIGATQEIRVTAADPKSGLRGLRAELVKDGKTYDLLDKAFAGDVFIRGGEVHQAAETFKIDKRALKISDGKAVLRIVVSDYSWRNWLRGNRTVLEKPIVIDTRPPRIEVVSKAHNINQGGAGVVIYRLFEPCEKSGVLVGENFFPGRSGYYRDPQLYVAFIALDYRQGVGTKMVVTAVDKAGNSAKAGFYHHIRRKRFRKDVINITDGFLKRKMPEFEAEVPQTSGQPLIDVFLKVNGELRRKNYDQLVAIGRHSDARMYWKGTFMRLPNSAPRARFADQRDYRYKGKVVDHQVHLGVDLASLARAKVPAANNGRVAFTGTVGIYGNTVVLDHGFGLFSLYSHLSRIDVEKGQTVQKGEVLGLTGATGLAGGDHLHYAMMVHQTFVNPIEWWDAAWIRNNVTDKLAEAGVPAAAPTDASSAGSGKSVKQ